MSKQLKDAEDFALKWYQETFDIVQKSPRPSDLIIMGELLVAKKHTLAVLTLIKEKHLLPAQVILRVLIELYIKLLWVMYDIKIKTEENDKKVYLRLQRLDKRRVEDDIKLIKDLDKNRFPKKNEILNSLNAQIAEYKGRGIKKSPDIASMCEKFDELGVLNTSNGEESWKGMIYAELYRNYSRAVHSDLGLVRKFVQREGGKILWFEDIKDDPEQLLEYTLTVTADINKLFQKYYTPKRLDEC